MSKRHLQRTYGITMHYSSCHHNYYSAWLYASKSDREFKESSGHPDLCNQGGPRTEEASRCRTQSARRAEDTEQGEDGDESSNSDSESDGNKSNNPRKRHLSAFEVSEIVIEKQIRSVTELHALAREQKSQGKTDLAEFILNRVPRRGLRYHEDCVGHGERRSDTTTFTKEENAAARRGKRRRLCRRMRWPVATLCPGDLEENDIGVELFRTAVNELLLRDQGKNRNLLLTGPTNCGKSFLLNPLKVIYRTFC